MMPVEYELTKVECIEARKGEGTRRGALGQVGRRNKASRGEHSSRPSLSRSFSHFQPISTGILTK
jgi:hypothetical protein